MKLEHDCLIPRRNVYYTVSSETHGWTCPICGERWSITYRRSGYDASRQRPVMRFIRHWRWRREVKRLMIEEGTND